MLFDQGKGKNPINGSPTQIASGTQFDWLIEHHDDLLGMSRTYGKVLTKAAKNFHIQEAVLTFMFYYWEKENHERAISVITNMATDLPKFKNRIYDLAFKVMSENYATMQGQKDAGMAVRAEKQRFIQAMAMRFTWESDSERAGSASSITGFKKSLNKWMASVADQKAWVELL